MKIVFNERCRENQDANFMSSTNSVGLIGFEILNLFSMQHLICPPFLFVKNAHWPIYQSFCLKHSSAYISCQMSEDSHLCKEYS